MPVPGPAALGRGVVLRDDQRVPAPWRDAPEVVIDDAVLTQPAPAVEALHDAWANRRPVVVRLLVDPARFREPESVVAEPYTLDPALELWHDRLHFLVWANTYDARAGEPVWWWAQKAQRLGATAAPDGVGDVVLPDGPRAWIDGGPRQPFPSRLDGAAVVHAETVELRRLTTVPPERAPRADLAPDQLAAVAHSAGPARIIAPAGSGKTRVLTERLRHLLVDRGYERAAVLAVAYNVRARDELVARCADFGPRVQTLNGLGFEVLREALGNAPRVLDEREVRRLVDDLLPRRRPRRANTDPIAPYLEALSIVRLGLRDPAEVEAERDDVEGLAALFGPYREALRSRGVVDFDEQVYRAVEVLLADGELRRRLQARCRHLLVDEFQDLTPAHVLLLRLLAAPRFDVFGVGDDDQVIYGHAGADPRFLLDFASLFPGADAHALEVNYRCPIVVVEAAGILLSWNRRRVPKSIRPGPAAPAGDRLTVEMVPAEEQASELLATVAGWLSSGVEPSDIAVLTRVNSLLLAPQVALADAGVPLAGGLGPEVLQRLGVRAALAYLRLATAPRSMAKADLVEVYRRPSRGLPEWIQKWFRDGTSVEGLQAAADRIDDPKVSDKLRQLAEDLELLVTVAGGRRGARTADVLLAIRDQVGLGAAMAQLDHSKGEGSSQLDDLEALLQVASLHPDPATFGAWLTGALRRPAADGGVTLATVHKVKGQEWGHVVLFGVSAGVLPHRLAADVEEERRVLHVGLTRGQQQVVVLADAARPSPFLPQLTAPRSGDSPEILRTEGRRDGSGGGGLRAGATPTTRGDGPAATGGRRSGRNAANEDPVFEALRAWRLERARADAIAPFVIFHDAVLRDIAAARPASLVALGRVKGVGSAKLTRYGDDVLAVLAQLQA